MLAGEGYRTLVVCFNSPLAKELRSDLAEASDRTGLIDVMTFHGLCEQLALESGVVGPKPVPTPVDWFTETLPDALVEAAERLGPRYHAIVVDEGQDFEVRGWRVSSSSCSIPSTTSSGSSTTPHSRCIARTGSPRSTSSALTSM